MYVNICRNLRTVVNTEVCCVEGCTEESFVVVSWGDVGYSTLCASHILPYEKTFSIVPPGELMPALLPSPYYRR